MVKPEQYSAATQELARLADVYEAARERLKEEEHKELWAFSERKDQLRQEEREATRRHEDARKAAEATHTSESAPFVAVQKQTRRIFVLMTIARSGKVATMGQVYTYSDSYPRERGTLQPLDTLAADEYKQIGVWIVPNGKPKNKFSLLAVGWSLFAHYEELGLASYRGYGVSINDEPYANIRTVLREGPDDAALQTWYRTKRVGILKDYLAEHAKIEAEYREATALLQDPAWLRLYLEDRKDYYERHYSRGTETPEYKALLEELAARQCEEGG